MTRIGRCQIEGAQSLDGNARARRGITERVAGLHCVAVWQGGWVGFCGSGLRKKSFFHVASRAAW
jgi:hypothetical protein